MRGILSAALLAGGILLLVFGFSASQSLGSELSKFFTGSPTNRAIWMLLGGVILAVLGSVGLISTGAKHAT